MLQIKMDKEAEEKRVEKEKRKRKAEGGADEEEEGSRKKKDDKEKDKGFGVAVTDAEMGTLLCFLSFISLDFVSAVPPSSSPSPACPGPSFDISLTSFLSFFPRAEEYHKTRDQRFDDPMAQVGKDELLPM